MNDPLTLTMVDGVRVVVPDSLELITPYVLREQGDWFEDEIKFLRRLLRPGQKAVDIGANYGVYALAIARLVGGKGHVWAFEPASSTARMLEAGIAANGFSNVSLRQSAVSAARGTAQLSLHENSELNSLQDGPAAGAGSETVQIETLDDCMESIPWDGIDFVKIDAEGEEKNILRGGARFFSAQSPLVMYETRVASRADMTLVRAFGELGYASYRLVPGLEFLVPFDAAAPHDQYLLNLFCCKPERAAQLAGRGHLVQQPLNPQQFRKEKREWFGRSKQMEKYGWRRALAKLPYGRALAPHWTATSKTGRGKENEEALCLYAIAQDTALPPAERYAALAASVALLAELCEREPAFLRRLSLARAALELGARELAVRSLEQARDEILVHQRLDPAEPFLAPSRRYDTLSPGSAIGGWICAGILEEIERNRAFSSYYTGPSAQPPLEKIHELGFASAETRRRLDLIRRRYPG